MLFLKHLLLFIVLDGYLAFLHMKHLQLQVFEEFSNGQFTIKNVTESFQELRKPDERKHILE